MIILGFLGSPRLKGKCRKLLKKALEGAESKGAETKRFDLIRYNIKHCIDCASCWTKNPELPIGKCPLKDDMASILEEYIKADGYIFASPAYDMFITSLMKKFLERKIALTYRDKDRYGKLMDSRVPANFKKKASFIVTANCGDEFEEVMGYPCYEAFETHLMLEQVDTVDKLYCGGVENMTEETFSKRLGGAYQMGIHLVEEIQKAQNEDQE